ncbi:MAG: 5'-nucleotidase [Syntrophorhabdus sp. PtaU1.Bin002]|nr:MAG: 5'-nucleotidase [Syntrophorhabdus sp. PtaB.Bin006]OPY61288.1 MAG: 5'-nucleotidase [Syntrophorhabdus sp. PtaU1.Bin002]
MITKDFVLKIQDAASMQRWNDKIRPVDLRELDKQAHKMIIAYFLGRFEEGKEGFDWLEVIEGGLFEFLQRLVITDLKPQIFDRIKGDHTKYEQLNEWVFQRLNPVVSPLGKSFTDRFRSYFSNTDDTLNKRILSAAHFYATRWEFGIIERANPQGYEIAEIRETLEQKQEKYNDLEGIQQLALYGKYRNFLDLCGQLRFQLRWGHINMVPRTSVLGHMLTVAILSYLFSVQINACPRRCINNYCTGLFHDLPEVLTRDIISPVKRSIEGLDKLIKVYEKEQMEKEVYRLIPLEWHGDMRMFTEDEFTTIAARNGELLKLDSDTISSDFNADEYNPRDGELVKASDDLAALVEAYAAIENGIKSKDLGESRRSIQQKYSGKTIAGIDFGVIMREF